MAPHYGGAGEGGANHYVTIRAMNTTAEIR